MLTSTVLDVHACCNLNKNHKSESGAYNEHASLSCMRRILAGAGLLYQPVPCTHRLFISFIFRREDTVPWSVRECWGGGGEGGLEGMDPVNE
jgi:hypothetical protein